jgi:hypothetical protein
MCNCKTRQIGACRFVLHFVFFERLDTYPAIRRASVPSDL